jgi:hypothetical protein
MSHLDKECSVSPAQDAIGACPDAAYQERDCFSICCACWLLKDHKEHLLPRIAFCGEVTSLGGYKSSAGEGQLSAND